MLAVFILGAAHGGRVITRIRPILLYIDGVAKRLLIFFFIVFLHVSNEFHTH